MLHLFPNLPRTIPIYSRCLATKFLCQLEGRVEEGRVESPKGSSARSQLRRIVGDFVKCRKRVLAGHRLHPPYVVIPEKLLLFLTSASLLSTFTTSGLVSSSELPRSISQPFLHKMSYKITPRALSSWKNQLEQITRTRLRLPIS